MRLRYLTPLLLVTFGGCGTPAPEGATEVGDGGSDSSASTPVSDASLPDSTMSSTACPSIDDGLVSNEDAPLSVATDNGYVYWVSSASQREIRRAPTAGGTVETLYSTKKDIGAIAVAKGTVVWGEPADAGGPAVLRTRSSTTGDVRTVQTFDATFGTLDPFGLAGDEESVYQIFRRPSPSLNQVIVVPLVGGTPATVSTFAEDSGSDVRSLSVNGGDLFWGYTSGQLFRASRGARGVKAVQLLNVKEGLDAWAVRSTDIVYAQAGAFRTLPRTGGTSAPLAGPSDAYRTILWGGSWLAWGTVGHGASEEIRVQREDGSICVVAKSEVKSVFSMATDGEKLFWTNTATRAFGGSVRWARLPNAAP